MAPPRLVRRSSTSPLASVSVFSAKAGAVSVAAGDGELLATGDADAVGEAALAGESVAVVAGVGEAAAKGAGLGGGKCEAVYAYQPSSPRTQTVMAIHAWRSIIVARRAIHRRGDRNAGAAFAPRVPGRFHF